MHHAQDAAADEAAEDSANEAADSPPPAKPPPAASSSASKKKNKKKKGKGKGKAGAAGGSDTEAAGPAAAQQAEDIDAILAQLGMEAGPSTSATSAADAESKLSEPPLLAIDPKKLRGDEELRRIFGSAVIDAVDRQDAADSNQQQQRRRGHVPRHLLRRRPLRKSLLVTPREEWPWVETGLGMEVVGECHGCGVVPRVCGSDRGVTVQAVGCPHGC